MAANRLLRERAAGLGVELKVPPSELCTDNAAMIASAARWVEPLRYPDYLDLDAYATGQRGMTRPDLPAGTGLGLGVLAR